MRAISVATAMTLLTSLLLAQPQPDFSGHWLLDSSQPAAAAVARPLHVTQTITSKNVRGEPMAPYVSQITAERTSASGVQIETRRLGVAGGMVGGVAAGSVSPPASRSEWSVTWDGERLVSYRHYEDASGGVSEHHEVWTLDSSRRLVVTTTTRSGDTRVVTTATYRRLP